jgi:hypothetical protein
VLQNINAQPLSPILSSLAAILPAASGIFATTPAKSATLLSYAQLLAALNLATTSTPTFSGITIAQISSPTGKLTVGCEILAAPGTTPASLVTQAQLSSIASGTIQLAPAQLYYTSAGLYSNNQITASAPGAFMSDGNVPSAGTRVLVNISPTACGIYSVAVPGAQNTYWQLVRTNDSLINARIMIADGNVYVGSSWIYSEAAGVFTQDGPSVAITAGAGISVTRRQVGLSPVISPATVNNPTNMAVNTYGQITSVVSRSASQVRADLDLISPTFTGITVGPVSISAAGVPYSIVLPTTAPTIGSTLIYSGTSLEWGTVQSTLTGIRATILVGYVTATAGGIAATNTWTVYPLNTIITDTAQTTTITNNCIIVPAGTFNIYASAAFCQVGGCVIRVFDATNNGVLVNGTAAYSSNGSVTIDDGSVVWSVAIGQITATAPISVRLEYYASVSSGAAYELGRVVTAANMYGYLQIVSVTDIVTASSDRITTGTLTVTSALQVRQVQTTVCTLTVVGPITLPANYRTYYLTGSPATMFLITPPPAASGLEIIIVNTTGFSGIFTTVYGSYSVANYTKQIFTYVTSLNGWI